MPVKISNSAEEGDDKKMTERKYYCLNCECKMDCIVLNLHSDIEICLKRDGDVE